MAAPKKAGQFLWGDDDSSAKARPAGTNLSGTRFSTRDYAVDQSVNLMDMGEGGPDVGSASGGRFSVAGLFRAKTGTEAPRFDEYGDAAPSGESEEYISDKQRRMTPIVAMMRNFFASKAFFSTVLGILGLVLLGGGIYLGLSQVKHESVESKDLKTILIDKGVTPAEVFAASPTNPQNMALKWIVHEDPARLPVDNKGIMDRYILAVFYFSSNDKVDGWTNNENWMTGSGICSWYGVECTPIEVKPTRENGFIKSTGTYDANDHILTLNLKGNNVKGAIPYEFGGFPELRTLNLSENQITGSIPPSLGKLPKIRDILLQKNAMVGSFPTELTRLVSLHQLNLGENQFEGKITDDISEMKNLRSFSVSTNKFEGPFPYVKPLSYLISLYLDNNQFTATVPGWLYSMDALTDLRLSKNAFEGSISDDIKKLRNLEILHFDHNQFEGPFPDMFDAAPRISELKLERNKFSGPIPSKIWHLQGLRELTLDNNKFTGPISGSIGTLADVLTLSMHENQLTGTIPTTIGNLNDIETLALNKNKLTGTIPTELGKCFRLSTLHLDQNQLSGHVPDELGALDRLVDVRLEMNMLDGTMPSEMCSLVRAQTLTHLSADCKYKVDCNCCNQCL